MALWLNADLNEIIVVDFSGGFEKEPSVSVPLELYSKLTKRGLGYSGEQLTLTYMQYIHMCCIYINSSDSEAGQ